MERRNLVLGILILLIALAGLWLKAYRNLPAEPDTVILKDDTPVKGEIVKQEFGKYVVIEKLDNTKQVIVWDQVKDIRLYNAPWYLRVNDALEGILKFGIIGGFIVFGVGLWQYNQSQKWKRAEFLLAEIRTFEPNLNVSNVRAMLDYERGDVYLYGEEEEPVTVDRDMLENALSTPEELQREHTDEELAIRDALDVYLSHLDHFNNIVESGLVRKKELKLYLKYWLDIIGDTKNNKLSPKLRKKFWRYMHANGFNGAISLLKKYRYLISNSAGIASNPGSKKKRKSETSVEK